MLELFTRKSMNDTYTNFRTFLVSQSELIEKSSGSVFSSIHILTFIPKVSNGHAFENANVQKFIKSTGHHFDVIVAEEFFGESFLMFAYKHQAPVVTICKFHSIFHNILK